MKRLHIVSAHTHKEIVRAAYLFTGNITMCRHMIRVGKLRNLLVTRDTSR